ncbi:hypothetical protein BCR44DRAFT_1246979 [Catenaria anguillulae PL171]|uniref:Uncharacterized protein n=1 Tax=Catenaria anguillulae PL171 TaxID=765915 RepID=A0A1Y2HY15_9FUNG|nr:hypothetical protein BCR44DRAFT_1246979 [Catenaria anguillulae PL171]
MDIKEGQFFRILNGNVTGKIKGRLRITANRRTAWIPYTPAKPEGPGGRAPTEYVPRTMVTEYRCLINPTLENEARLAYPDAAAVDIPKLTTEVDLRGFILDVRRVANSGAGMELHLMDATRCGFVVVKLYERMWIPAFHDSLAPGVCVELRNIKTRRMDSRFYVPYLESTEETEIVKVRGVGVASKEQIERGRQAMADPIGRGQMQLGQREMQGVNIGEFFSQSP